MSIFRRTSTRLTAPAPTPRTCSATKVERSVWGQTVSTQTLSCERYEGHSGSHHNYSDEYIWR